ncbi:hypothetical protein KJ359_006112 [Pestalotiopsis sp. 9143b]|nr:hypothetical protein KJ359_006112 [Pestalotiopsis sp. 9143b]
MVLGRILKKNLPSTLKSLTIFEDNAEFYDIFPDRWLDLQGFLPFQPDPSLPPPTLPGPTLGETMAAKSLNLHHLALSFLVDAKDIMRHFHTKMRWKNLESLALTAQRLREDRSGDRIEYLLCFAAKFAAFMPKLRTMILWYGGKGHAAAVTYRIHRVGGDVGASLTWRGTWHWELRPSVVDAWRKTTAAKLPRCELQIAHEEIEAPIESHADAIFHLRLPCQVVEPASLWQMRREARTFAQ